MSFDIKRVADKIYREAIGFPTEDAFKKYMRSHPKADPKNHWVEKNHETGEVPETKKPNLYVVPKAIGRGSQSIDMTKSLLRSSTPDANGDYKWYDFNGEEVKDDKTLFRVNRLSRELSVISPQLVNVRVFTDYRPGSQKPFAMAYSDKWLKQKSSAPFKYFYTEIQKITSTEKIMAKNIKFSKSFSEKVGEITEDAEKGIPEAVVVHFINKHHIRIGTKGQKNDGICTMRAKFCRVVGDTVEIKNMPTKSNKKYSAIVSDPILVREFKKRLAGKEPSDLVFGDTDSVKVNNYLKETLGDKSFSNKNLRTCEATGIAFSHVMKKAIKYNEDRTWSVKKLSLDQRYAIMAEACLLASQSLNNTPSVCHSSYIDNKVFNVLALPDNDYHKDNPIEGKNSDGTYKFKWEAKIEKAEASIRKMVNDDEYNIWDKYVEARDQYLRRLNEDRRKDGWTTDLKRLPQLHATALIKRFLTKEKK